MKFFHNLTKHADYGLLVLRLAVGFIFLLHGLQKWSMWGMEPSAQMPENMLNLMRFLSIVEPLGGLALIFGFLTQLASIGLGIIMLGAMYYKIYVWNIGFVGKTAAGGEYDFILLAAVICLLFTGAGKIALDRHIWKH